MNPSASTVIDLIHQITHIKRDKILPQSRFLADLHMNGVDKYELILELEDKTGMDIPDEIYESWNTVQDVYDYLNKREQ